MASSENRINLDLIHDRHDAETVIEALFHHLHTLARQDEEGVRSKAAQHLTTLAGRLRATLDRTPEYYEWAKGEGQPIARFPYEPDEAAPERP